MEKISLRKILKLMVLRRMFGQVIGWVCFEYLEDNYILIGLLTPVTSLRYLKTQIYQNDLNKKNIKKIKVTFIREIGWCGFSGFSIFVVLAGGIPAQFFYYQLV